MSDVGAKHPDFVETGQVDSREEMLADVLAFVLAGRPERIEDGLVGLGPPDLRHHVRDIRSVLSALAVACPPEAPDVSLRQKLLASVTRQIPRRAIVVIDMIHDHLEPGTLLEVPRARAIVPALEERLAAARARNMPIVYVVDEHEADDPDLDAWGTHALKGTKGTEVWKPLAPRTGDLVVKKPSYSAFFESDLGRVLDELGVDTLVLTGCLTELGVHATATDALQRGFVVEIPPETQAGSSPQAEQATLGTLGVMAPFGPARKARLDRLAIAA